MNKLVSGLLVVGLAAFGSSQLSAQAQQGQMLQAPSNGGAAGYPQAPAGVQRAPAYGTPYYGNRWNNGWGNGPFSGWGGGPFNSGPFSGWGGGPFNSGPFGSWGGGPFNNGPFSGGWSRPWNGGPMNWSGRPFSGNNWGNNIPFMGNWDRWGTGPGPDMRAFRPWDPRNSAEDVWDEMLNAPSSFGRMPGGWTAPTISVPNPVDVGDQFGEAMKDMPSQIRNFSNN